jgi:hypothetical protein
VALFREVPENLVAQPWIPGGTVALGTDDLDSDFEGGARILLGRSLGDWYRLEGSWLGSYSWSDTVAARTADELASLGVASTMNSAELNLRRRLRVGRGKFYQFEASALLGLRYLRIREDFDYFAEITGGAAPVGTNLAAVRADNRLFGVQVGGLFQFLSHDRAWVDFEVKGGIFSNSAGVDSTYTAVSGATTGFVGDEDRTSLMVDSSLMLNWQLAPAWTLRMGYNATWLWGLALGSRNVSPDAALPPLTVDHDGRVLYHGPSIGVTWAR